jgi:serine/threonine protein kinase
MKHNTEEMTQEKFKKRYAYDPVADKLGEGGFGSVFKAYDTHHDRWVALKISKVNPGLENIRLKREVEMVAELPSHPNIAHYENCFTFTSIDGVYDFGILQYYEQGNLAQLLKKSGLSLSQKQNVLTQILSGIEFLHNNSIIHRDLKPQNILVVKRKNEYVPKITDFGISKQLDVNRSSIFSNSIAGAGTLAYSSPEQLGELTIRKNADLWSFGVVAYQTFTGSLPFSTGVYGVTSEAGRQELFRQIKSGQLPTEINSIAKPWQRLIRACLVPDPEKRVKNCEACVAILKGENDRTHIDPTPNTSPNPSPKPEPRPNPSPNPSPEPNLKPKFVKRIILGIVGVGGLAGLVAILFMTGILVSSPSPEKLQLFEEYKQAASTNYENAKKTDDADLYSIAPMLCPSKRMKK